MIYGFVWFGCSIATAVIYHAKGGDGAAGLLMGICLGPIGVLLAIFVRPNNRTGD